MSHSCSFIFAILRILTSSGKIYLEYVVNKVKDEMTKPETEGRRPSSNILIQC